MSHERSNPMKCPHCGHKNPPNTVFCQHCDSWILGQVYTEDRPPKKARRPIPLWARLCLVICVIALPLSLCLTLLLWPEAPEPSMPVVLVPPIWTPEPPGDTLLPTTEPPITQPPISFDPGPAIADSDYILRKGDWIVYNLGNTSGLFYNGQLVSSDRTFSSSLLHTSLEGTVGLYQSLLLSDGRIVETAFRLPLLLSNNGNTIAYEEMILDYDSRHITIYDVETKKDQRIVIDYRANLRDFCISPNGQTLAYSIVTDHYGEYEIEYTSAIYLWQNGETKLLAEMEGLHSPLSVSDDGNVIYLSNGYRYTLGDLHVIRNQGEPYLLGNCIDYQSISAGTSYISSVYPFRNADNTQLLYYQKDGTYLSVDGQPRKKLSAKIISPVAPQLSFCSRSNSQSISYVYPHADLRNQVYASAEYTTLETDPATIHCVYTLYYLGAAGNLTQLATDVSEFSLDPSGQHLYYLTHGGTLERIDLTESFTPHILDANSVDTFAITYNSSLVYYISANGLYVLQESTGTRAKLMDVMNTPLYVTADNALHLRIGTALLSYDPINGVRRTQSDVTDCTLGTSGILYVTTENGTFVYLPQSSTWEQIIPT